MDDLNDAMEDFETRSHANLIQKPDHFDQVVDIAVQESRQKALEAAAEDSDGDEPSKGLDKIG